MQSNYHQERFPTGPPPAPRLSLASLFILRARTAKAYSNKPACSREAFKGSCCSLVFEEFRLVAKHTGKKERVPEERLSNKLMGPGSFLSRAPLLCYLLGYWLQSPWIQLRFSCFEFLSEIKSMWFITQCSPRFLWSSGCDPGTTGQLHPWE